MSRYKQPRPVSSAVERRARAIGLRLQWSRSRTGDLAIVTGLPRLTVERALLGSRTEQLAISERTWAAMERGVGRLQRNRSIAHQGSGRYESGPASLLVRIRSASETKRDAAFAKALGLEGDPCASHGVVWRQRESDGYAPEPCWCGRSPRHEGPPVGQAVRAAAERRRKDRAPETGASR